VFYAIASLGFWLVNGLSVAEEWRREGQVDGWIRALTQEGISVSVILALFVPVAFYERRFPVSLERWGSALAAHMIGSAVFAAVHIAGMTGLRMALWPIAFEDQYLPHGGLFGEVIYEYRKDVLSYALMLAVLALMRQREDALQQARAARSDARTAHVITLRSGGREIRLPADDIICASAAGNYVQVTTPHGTHLARMTLTRLFTLLDEAGAEPVRLHRSHLTRRACIREILPTGEGDAQVRLSTGQRLPVSRQYRAGV